MIGCKAVRTLATLPLACSQRSWQSHSHKRLGSLHEEDHHLHIASIGIDLGTTTRGQAETVRHYRYHCSHIGARCHFLPVCGSVQRCESHLAKAVPLEGSAASSVPPEQR